MASKRGAWAQSGNDECGEIEQKMKDPIAEINALLEQKMKDHVKWKEQMKDPEFRRQWAENEAKKMEKVQLALANMDKQK